MIVLLTQKLIEVEWHLSKLQRLLQIDRVAMVVVKHKHLADSLSQVKATYGESKANLVRDLKKLELQHTELGVHGAVCLAYEDGISHTMAEILEQILRLHANFKVLEGDLAKAYREREAINGAHDTVVQSSTVLEDKLEENYQTFSRLEDPAVLAQEAEQRVKVRLDGSMAKLWRRITELCHDS